MATNSSLAVEAGRASFHEAAETAHRERGPVQPIAQAIKGRPEPNWARVTPGEEDTFIRQVLALAATLSFSAQEKLRRDLALDAAPGRLRRHWRVAQHRARLRAAAGARLSPCKPVGKQRHGLGVDRRAVPLQDGREVRFAFVPPRAALPAVPLQEIGGRS